MTTVRESAARAIRPSLAAVFDRPDRRCLDVDTEVFFPDQDIAGLVEPARRYCAVCPALTPCLAYALLTAVDGVWGGTTAPERAQLRTRYGITDVAPVTAPAALTASPARRRRPSTVAEPRGAA